MSEPIVPEQSSVAPIDPPRPHPVRIVDSDDLKRSRLTVAFRLLLVFPHVIWLALYSVAAVVVGTANWFATLIRGRSPQRIHNWLVRYLRYTVFVYAYLYVLANPYPPFHGTAGSYPIDLEVDGPDRQRRLVTAFRPILAIPAWVLNFVFSQVLQIVALLAWFVAIAIGRMPRGMENLGLYSLRYNAQTNAYLFIVTDHYPSPDRLTVIDLRSDTASKPTPAMREAIANADVGDEQLREDPTVNELERRIAETLGQEDSVFVPTATMANEIALRVLGEPGDELIAEENSHILIAELGGPAVHAGLMTRPLPAKAGRFTPEQVRAAARRGDLGHVPTTRIVAIENTHNSSGGRVWPLAEIDAMAETCRELELSLHLDGARLFNAAVASGEEPAAIAHRADTVTICFSKGLGCPLGAVIAGSSERMLRARRFKHQFGGAMRQAGIVAAACVYALDHHVERLAEDHARARSLGERLHEAGVPVDLEQVETNFVQIDVGALGLEVRDALERLLGEGIRLTPTMLPGILRAVTHLAITDEDIDLASDAIPRALGVAARV